MNPRIIIKTVRNFYCRKVGADVHIEYCTDLQYQERHPSHGREVLINPDCERKEGCGIACQQGEKVIYDWSCCANPDLQTALCRQGREQI